MSAKYVYGRLMRGSRHQHSNTVVGWGVWISVVAAIWAIAFVFGSVIPSMGDFLSLLGAAFDVSALIPMALSCSNIDIQSFFGFIYWAL